MNEKIKMIAFVLVLGAFLTTALVFADAITAPFIAKNKAKKLQESVLTAAGIDYTDDTRESLFSSEVQEKIFPDELQEKGATEDELKKYYVMSGGNVVFEFHGSGLQGPVHGAIALDKDLETIKGITIIHQEETPGLGGRIGESEFLDQFKSKKLFPVFRIRRPGKASGINEIDGISGATLSCNALEEMLNKESKKYIPAIKETITK
jgi:Na+-transporting NADH:ubiquinone oxidoreductase subunit C